jgi:uncharacterized protein YggE
MDSNGPTGSGRSRPHITRRPLIVAGLVAALAAGAGGTALAAALTHHDAATAATSAGSSVFVPLPGSSVPGSTGTSAGLAAPAPALGAASAASPIAPGFGGAASSSPVLPYYGGCTPQGAQIQGSVISATGSTQIDVASVGQSLNLNAGVQDQSSSDAGTALRQAQAKVDAIVSALVRAGIPRSAIHSSYYSVSPYPGVPVPLGVPGNQRVEGFQVNGNVSATATDLDQLVRATNAAAAAGASNVSVSSSAGYNVAQPSADRLSAAIAQASASAKAMATAAADSAGVHLGGVHSLVVAPPAMCGYGADGPQLTLAVTSAWDVAR